MSASLLGNRYRVLSELGQGAMGAVHRVADTLDGDRELALKRLQVEGGMTAEARLRFKAEFRAMSRLRHPNTIEVHGSGQLEDGTPFLTMEIVPGQELADLARGATRVPVATAIDWLGQLLQALGFIHSREYVHRDIKAQNIRITPEGRLKLMDFGLMERAGRGSRGAALTGTPGYMPPEAITGGTVTSASDLYSVGCLAYELLAGRLPFEGKVIEVVRAQVKSDPPSLRALVPDVPQPLEALIYQLLAKDPAHRPASAAAVVVELAAIAGRTGAGADLDQRTSYLEAANQVGRDTELHALESDLALARQGAGRAVFVAAPAGVGKSRLLRELLLAAQWQDVEVLAGTCAEAGQEALAPLRQALRPLLAAAGDEEWLRHGGAIAALYHHAPLDPDALRTGLAAWIADAAARSPVVLAIEDIQWADAPTLGVLNELAPALPGLPVMLIATLRGDETPAGSAAWFAVNEGLARLLPLSPLPAPAAEALVVAMLGAPALPAGFARDLHAAAGGNPFFLTELLRWLMLERVLTVGPDGWRLPADLSGVALPASAADAVRRRLSRLGAAARAVAAAAAILGRPAELQGLAAVAGLPEAELREGLAELVERQVLAPEGAGWGFPQAGVRDAVAADLDTDTRQALHERAGCWLEAADQTPVAELAWHFTRGLDQAKALAYQVRLGVESLAAGHVAVAVPAWQAAVRLVAALDPPDAEARLAGLRLLIGLHGYETDPAAAIAALDLAFPFFEAQAEATGDPLDRATLMQCLAALAQAYGQAGEPAVALAMADLLGAVAPPGPSPGRSAALAAAGPGKLAAGHFDALIELAREASRGLVSQDLTKEPPLVRAARIRAVGWQNAIAFQGLRPDDELRDYAMGLATEQRAWHLAAEVQLPFVLWNAWTGREAAAIAGLDELTRLARLAGAPPSPWLLYLRPWLLRERGETEDALALARQALRYPHLDQAVVVKRLLEVLHGSLLLDLGDVAGAEAALWPIEAQARQSGQDLVRMQALLALAHVLFAQGEREHGVAALQLVEKQAREGPARNPLVRTQALRWLGERATAEGDAETGLSLLSQGYAIATEPRQSNLLLEAHLKSALAAAHLGIGRPDAARIALIEAGRGFQKLGLRHLLPGLRTRAEALPSL